MNHSCTTTAQGRRSRRHPLFALALIIALPASALAQQLSIEEASRLAVSRSQRIAESDARTSAARDRAVAAGTRPDPVFTAGIQNLPINTDDRFRIGVDSMTMRTLGIKQELTGSVKRSARAAQFSREAEANEAQRSVAAAELNRDARLAWLEVSYLEASAALLDADAIEASRLIDAAEAAYRGGRGSQSDFVNAKLQLEIAHDRQRVTERDIAVARTRLARWIGSDADRPLAPPVEIKESPAPIEVADLASRLTAHPQFVQFAAEESAARADADRAYAERSNDWSVEFMYGKRGPNYSDMATLNLSIPIAWNRAERQDREWSAKRAEAEAMHDHHDESRRDVEAALRAAIATWRSDHERLVRYDAAFMPLAAQRSTAALAAYRGGGAGGSLTAVLDARRAEVQTRLDRLALERALAQTRTQLDYWLTGSTRKNSASVTH